MEYETKYWVVRWNVWLEDGRPYRTYNKFFKDPLLALTKYKKMVALDTLSAQLIRIDVENNEYVIDSLERHIPVSYGEGYTTRFKWQKEDV